MLTHMLLPPEAEAHVGANKDALGFVVQVRGHRYDLQESWRAVVSTPRLARFVVESGPQLAVGGMVALDHHVIRGWGVCRTSAPSFFWLLHCKYIQVNSFICRGVGR